MDISSKLQTPEMMRLFGSTKNVIAKTENGENILSLEVAVLISPM